MESSNNGRTVLEIKELKKAFELPLGLLPWILGRKAEVVTAVDDVSFTVQKGEILGVVGESGCGKTTLLRCIAKVYDPDSGQILFEGNDITGLNRASMRPIRRKIQMIFQDPYSSLNPRFRVRDILGEVLRVHNIVPPDKREERVKELLALVGMGPDALGRLPSQFSGGQRQRIGIARALAMEPTLILADEPVSALDVSIQAQVINLLMELQEELGLTMIFVAHDLRVVRHISDRVAVMYLGKVMEIGPTERIFANPVHPYTRALLAAAPEPDPTIRSEVPAVQGDPPSPIHIPPGCRFHPRCASGGEACRTHVPTLEEVEQDHFVACHL